MESAIIFDRTKYKDFDRIYREVANQYFESEYFELEYFESDFFDISKSPFLQGFSSSFKKSYDAPERHFEKFRDAIVPYIKKAYQGASVVSKKTGITFPLVLSMAVAGITSGASAGTAIPIAAIMYFARQPLNKILGKGVSAAVDAVMGPDGKEKEANPEEEPKGDLKYQAKSIYSQLLATDPQNMNSNLWRKLAVAYNKVNDQARKIPISPETKELKEILVKTMTLLKKNKPSAPQIYPSIPEKSAPQIYPSSLEPSVKFSTPSFREWLALQEEDMMYMTEEEKQGLFSRMARGLGSLFGATTGYVAGATKSLFTGLASRVKEIYKYVTNNPKMVVKLAAIMAVSMVTGGILGKVSHSIQDAITQKVSALVPDVNPQEVQNSVAQVAPAADVAQAKAQAVADVAQAKAHTVADLLKAHADTGTGDAVRAKLQALVDQGKINPNDTITSDFLHKHLDVPSTPPVPAMPSGNVQNDLGNIPTVTGRVPDTDSDLKNFMATSNMPYADRLAAFKKFVASQDDLENLHKNYMPTTTGPDGFTKWIPKDPEAIATGDARSQALLQDDNPESIPVWKDKFPEPGQGTIKIDPKDGSTWQVTDNEAGGKTYHRLSPSQVLDDKNVREKGWLVPDGDERIKQLNLLKDPEYIRTLTPSAYKQQLDKVFPNK